MKNIIILLLIFLMFSITSFADFGIKLGFNSTSFKFSHSTPTEWAENRNFQAGLFYNFPLSKNLKIQPEIFYTSSGANTSATLWGSPINITEILTYLKLPVLFKYSIINRKKLQTGIYLGPYFAYCINAKTRATYEERISEEEITEQIRGQDYGFIFGTFADLKHFLFDLRFSTGIVNLSPNFTEYHVKNKAVVFLLGYRF